MKKTKKKSADRFEDFEAEQLPFVGASFLERHPIHAGKTFGVFLLLLTVFSFSSLFGLAGSLGRDYFTFFTEVFGTYAYIAPLIYLLFAYLILRKHFHVLKSIRFWCFVALFFIAFIFLGFFAMAGLAGNSLARLLQITFGNIPTVFLLSLSALLILFRLFETSISEIVSNRFSPKSELLNLESEVEEEAVETYKQTSNFFQKVFSFFSSSKPKVVKNLDINHLDRFGNDASFGDNHENPDGQYEEVEEEVEQVDHSKDDVRMSMYEAAGVKLSKEEREKVTIKRLVRKEVPTEVLQVKKDNAEKIKQIQDTYQRPPISMYTEDSGKSSAGDNKENARIIKRTLNDFGISVEMDEVTVGPTVTRYALKPAQGVKIEKIMNLANNIALELGVSSVSITRVHERSLIGIEVPNKQKAKLGLANLLGTKEFNERKEKLTLAFGKDIYGSPAFADMAKMPHLLVAGTTGAGKSVLVHGLINSLIYKNSPYDLKFILVDPKKVEFALYANLPHLFTPVIKDPKKAIQTLNWLVQEMDRRYQVLEDAGKQNISSYHLFVAEKYKKLEGKVSSRDAVLTEKLPEKMPYIILVIDELADFMMKYPKEMESGIVKLAQMSRAVGIHLILATQRPSTNIITGVIKGNIPSRVALRVASQVDSRVIIDQGGAEKLLGYGDLLLQTSDSPDLRRIQSPNVTEEETKEVVAYLRSKYDDLVAEDLKTADGSIVGSQNLNSSFNGGGNNGPVSDSDFNSDDDKYEDAKQVVMQTGKTSISNLQVRLGTGYARSAKLINMLESAGVIITVNDNNGKKVKVVRGQENANQRTSEDLEKVADKILDGKQVDQDEYEDATENGNKQEKNSGFFRF